MKLTEIATPPDNKRRDLNHIYNLVNTVVTDGEFTVDPETLVVNVLGSVEISDDFLKNGELPVVFGKVTRGFLLSPNAHLKSLKGTPREIGQNFFISDTMITSFVGGPEIVHLDYIAYNTPVTSMEGLPAQIGGMLHLGGCNNLKSLDHLPRSIGSKVKTVFGGLYLPESIVSLHNMHKTHADLVVKGAFSFGPSTTHLLSLLLIPGISRVYSTNEGVTKILNKHLEGGRDVNACQEDLIDAGFIAQARL